MGKGDCNHDGGPGHADQKHGYEDVRDGADYKIQHDLIVCPSAGQRQDARLHAMRLPTPRLTMLIVLSSALQVAIFPVAGVLPPWRAALSWFALTPLLWALLPAGRSRSVREAALISYSSGVLWYLGTCYWVYSTMHLYGGLSVAISLLTLVLMCLYLALYHALFGALLALVRRFGITAALAASPLIWVAVELARARVTSFPWNLLGYAQVDNSALTLLAPITGVYGISFVLVAVNACIAGAIVLPRRRPPAVVALVAAVIATGLQNFGTWIRPETHLGTQKAVLLQSNLQVGGEELLGIAPLAASSAELTLQAATLDEAKTAIAFWPEAPSPFQIDRAEFTDAVSALSRQLHAPVIAGSIGTEAAPLLPRGYRVYNSAALFTPERGYVGRYDKIHLVPFGEFVPYANLFQFASGLTEAVGTFNRGRSRTALLADGHRYGVFLCYESIFGDEVRRFVNNGAEVIANLSDDGWYGDSSAPFQHINMARMRAIENHRWLLRDTNTGITASIDPEGRIVETMQRHKRGAVVVHFDYLQGTTFYTRHGDVFAYACAIAAALLIGCALVVPRKAEVN